MVYTLQRTKLNGPEFFCRHPISKRTQTLRHVNA